MKLCFLRAGAAESATEGVSDGAERAVSSDPVPIRVALGDSSDVDVAARASIHDAGVLYFACAVVRILQ